MSLSGTQTNHRMRRLMRSVRSMMTVKWSVATTLLGASLSVFAGASPPDISGIWSRSAADSAQPAGDPPLKQKYLRAYQALPKSESQTNGKASGALETCAVEGLPTIMAAREPLEILQTPGQVTVLAEYMSQTRRILLDEKPQAAEDINPGYMGYSIAKWNGDTLEVQTVGIREDVRYRNIPHSGKLKITEKIRLTGPDQLQDQLTLLDPDTLTQPYRLTFNYKREPQHRIMEYPCKHGGAAAASPESSGATPAGKEQPKSK